MHAVSWDEPQNAAGMMGHTVSLCINQPDYLSNAMSLYKGGVAQAHRQII